MLILYCKIVIVEGRMVLWRWYFYWLCGSILFLWVLLLWSGFEKKWIGKSGERNAEESLCLNTYWVVTSQKKESNAFLIYEHLLFLWSAIMPVSLCLPCFILFSQWRHLLFSLVRQLEMAGKIPVFFPTSSCFHNFVRKNMIGYERWWIVWLFCFYIWLR